jgi:hypothetical protein
MCPIRNAKTAAERRSREVDACDNPSTLFLVAACSPFLFHPTRC